MTTVDLRPILHVHVVGTPRPKGSLRHVGGGRLIESLEGSPDWRAAVVDHAHRDYTARGRPSPYEGPVKVFIGLEFAPPRKWTPALMPHTVRTGDIDKHARNILDAMQDAGVIRNDAQVVNLVISKRYATVDGIAGADITVWPAAAEDTVPGSETTDSGAGRRTTERLSDVDPRP